MKSTKSLPGTTMKNTSLITSIGQMQPRVSIRWTWPLGFWKGKTMAIIEKRNTDRTLFRNLATSHGREEEEDAQQKNLFVQSGMQYKICRDTYHMFYIIGTEDILMRLPSTQPSIPVSSSSQSQSSQSSSLSSSPNTKWKSWLESDQGWSKGITDKDQAEKDARQLLFAASIQ